VQCLWHARKLCKECTEGKEERREGRRTEGKKKSARKEYKEGMQGRSRGNVRKKCNKGMHVRTDGQKAKKTKEGRKELLLL
jgi:hypothetical protein